MGSRLPISMMPSRTWLALWALLGLLVVPVLRAPCFLAANQVLAGPAECCGISPESPAKGCCEQPTLQEDELQLLGSRSEELTRVVPPAPRLVATASPPPPSLHSCDDNLPPPGRAPPTS